MSKFFGLAVGAVVVVAAPFIIPGPDGKPLANLDFVKEQFGKGLEPLEGAGDAIKDVLPKEASESSGTTVYKYQDANGQWHYGDKNVANAQQLNIESDMNIVDLPDAPPKVSVSKANQLTVIPDSSSSPLGMVKDVAEMPGKIKQYEQDAFEREEQMRKLLEQ